MLLVRDFEHRDVAPACALTNWYIEHTAIHFATVPATDAEFEQGWRAGRERHPWVAAELDGAFAGYAKAYVWRERAAYARTCECGLYVARGLERRGVGRALYRELLARLAAAGFHTVVAGISLPNDASVALHEALGFQKVGHFRECGFKFGRFHDVAFWQLALADATG
jgi:phosphinothricin acetyltransferase